MASSGVPDGLMHSRCASRASTASFTSSHENDRTAEQSATSRRQSKLLGTPSKKAKRIRFYRNGDRYIRILYILYKFSL